MSGRPADIEQLRDTIALLESSLKSEIARREEQHEYINMLKQALTTKLHDSGLLSVLSSAKGNLQDNEIQLYLELSKIQNIVDQHKQDRALAENKVSQLSQQLEKLKYENEQLNASLKEQSRVIEKTNENLDKLLVTISGFEEENKKLLTEKDSLLDYMEDLSKELERTKQESREKEIELGLKQKQIYELQTKYREDAPCTCDSDSKMRKLVSDLKEITEISVEMEGKLKILATENAKITREYATLQGKYETVVKEQEELEKKSGLKQHLAVERNELNSIPEKDTIETDWKKSRKEISKFELQGQENQMSSSFANETSRLKSIIEDYKIKLEREQSAKVEETRVLYERLSELKNEIKKQSEEQAALEEQRDSLQEQLRELKDKFIAQEADLNDQRQENERLNKAIEGAEEKRTEMERECFTKQITELNQKLEDLEKEHQTIQMEREQVQIELKTQNETIRNLTKQLCDKETIIINAQAEREKLSKQLESVKRSVLELAKYLQSIATSEESNDVQISQVCVEEDQITLPLREILNVLVNGRSELKSHLVEAQAKNNCLAQEKSRLEQEINILSNK